MKNLNFCGKIEISKIPKKSDHSKKNQKCLKKY